MLRALRTAALGMTAQQRGVDNIANNLANANTTGFKRSTIVFQDLLYQNVQAAGENEAGGAGEAGMLQMGNGAAPIATVRNFTQGGLVETGNALDLAINGDGFLQVLRPDGSVAYTRDGTLTVSADGMLVTQTGLTIEPDISIPADAVEISVSQDGLVSVRLQGEPDRVEIAQLELARFQNAGGLMAIGGNLFEQTEASGEPVIGTPGTDGLGTIRQGYVEGSNVDVVQEMVNLITAQRAYEINSKMITTGEDMLQVANNLKR
ncbi:MAG: flagellar basal-body rod protein FlgG [Bacteroidota bacterium]